MNIDEFLVPMGYLYKDYNNYTIIIKDILIIGIIQTTMNKISNRLRTFASKEIYV